MKEIKDLILDEERALYDLKNTKIVNIKFDGIQDGESALKECGNLNINNCYFNLRYPLWHVDSFVLENCEMTNNARAAMWYCKDIDIIDCKLNGIKALRECSDIIIKNTDIESFEFGWKCNNLGLVNTNITGEYLFLDSNNIKFNNVKMKER